MKKDTPKNGVLHTVFSCATALSCLGAHAQSDVTYQYYRFTTTQTAGEGLIQLSEFDLIDDGARIDYSTLTISNPGGNSPENEDPPKVVDSDLNTKWLDFNIAPLVFTFAAPITIDSYNFATANDALGRTPISWTFEGSTNGTTWTELDSRSEVTPPDQFFTFHTSAFDIINVDAPTITQFSSNNAILPTTESFNLSWTSIDGASADITPTLGAVPTNGSASVNSSANIDETYTLTVTNADGSADQDLLLRSVTQASATYRYFRFTPLKLRNGVAASSIQVSEFSFSNGGAAITPTAVENPGGDTPTAEGPENIIDGDIFSKWLDFNIQPLVFDFDTPTAIDAYNLTTGGDAPERDPIRWIIEGSDDGSAWSLVDNVTSFDFPLTENRNASFQEDFLPLAADVKNLPTGNFPIVSSFRNDPSITLNGTDSELSWDILLTDSVTIEPGIGTFGRIGMQTVSPVANSDTPFSLTANGSGDVTTSTLRMVAQGSATFRYLRFTPTKLRDFDTAIGIQLSEFTFANSGGTVTPSSVVNPDGDHPAGQGPANLLDENTTTKWNDQNEGRLVFDLGSATEITSYSLTTADNLPGLDPVRWILEGSNNESSWTLIDNVTAFDFGTNPARQTSAQSVAIPVPTEVDPVLFYDFESGLQGWANVLSSTIADGSMQFASGGAPFPGAPGAVGGSNSIGPDPFGLGGGDTERDRANETMLLRSPEFVISGDGSLTAYLIGGQRVNDPNPTSADTLPLASNSGDGQFLGLGLRRVSDDAYVLTRERSSNSAIWEEITITAEELAAVTSDGEAYTLDLIDYAEGGWGWLGLDSVSIPGTRAPIDPLAGLRILSQSFDVAGGEATITFASKPGKTYQITSSTDLESFPIALSTVSAAIGSDETTFTVSYTPSPKLFFRVEEVLNP